MPLLIPIERDQSELADSFFEQRVVIEEVTYTLRFIWQDTTSTWLLTVLNDDASEILIAGYSLRANSVVAPNMADRRPSGFFGLVDTGATMDGAEEPGFTDLGFRHQLRYYSLAEVEAARGR